MVFTPKHGPKSQQSGRREAMEAGRLSGFPPCLNRSLQKQHLWCVNSQRLKSPS